MPNKIAFLTFPEEIGLEELIETSIIGSVENLNESSQTGNNSRDVVEDDFEFDLLDQELEFSGFERFPELSFHDGEDRFNFVALVIRFLIKRPGKTSSVISPDPFSFTISHRDLESSIS